MNKLPHSFSRNDRSFLSYTVDTGKFSVKFFYDKKSLITLMCMLMSFLKN